MRKKKEESFGIIALRKKKSDFQVLFVKHGKGHWAFPKGHAEKKETPIQAAERELKEETGLSIKKLLDLTSLEEHYFFRAGNNLIEKRVIYFLAEVEGEVSLQTEEISDFVWVPLKEASERATFPETKRLCQKVIDLLQKKSHS